MEELKIYPDPILRVKAEEMEFDFKRVKNLVPLMGRVLKKHNGVGLALPQIGILEQMILIEWEGKMLVLINPRIKEEKGETIKEEGCLSLPGVEIKIRRASFIEIESLNEDGKFQTIKATNTLARIIQHEIDHLNGKLIIDALSFKDKLNFYLLWQGGKYEEKHPSTVL
jgi:peptide deformylase